MLHAREDYNDRIIDTAGIIPADEPVCLVRGQDQFAAATVDAWANLAEAGGADPAMVEAGRRHAERIREWQSNNPDNVKVPDAPEWALH